VHPRTISVYGSPRPAQIRRSTFGSLKSNFFETRWISVFELGTIEATMNGRE